jgi:outer membrane protein assembly factor BamC
VSRFAFRHGHGSRTRSPAVATACIVACLVSGCTAVQQVTEDRKVDYRSEAAKTANLDVPPDLTQLNRDGRSSPQAAGTVSASSQIAAPAVSPLAGSAVVAPAALGDFRIERQGQQRWLVTSRSPEQLWEPIKGFWLGSGFTLDVENAQAGVMETAWAENRAKLPDDVIRRTLGRVFENLYSTGERDRFRTRLERTASGGTEIFISHRGLEEVYTSATQERTAWQARASDPQLEAEFLTRLMIRLGAAEQSARQAVAQAPDNPPEARVVAVSNATTLQLDEGFDRAWRRVGLALDRSGFTVEDRDRGAGLFFVRYIDPASTAVRDDPSLLDRLRGRNREPKIERYRVQIKAEGRTVLVSLQNAQGMAESGATAIRILGLIAADLR